mmetsp:Transcript_44416/g.71140  ORF Transcript_44416/g.71140 Transcript_44416/m.71140 type:complete len:196 (-) Transcript_44416:40-627(-)
MSFLWNYISQALDYFGLSQYFPVKGAKIVFLGLDNAGKSTLFTLLQTGSIAARLPTDKAVSDEMVINGINFSIEDVGGHFAMRRVWRDHCVNMDAIVFMVDAAEQCRFKEVKTELNVLLSANELKEVPVLVFGNKIDKKEAVSEQTFRKALGLTATTGKQAKQTADDVRPIEVFMCSVVRKAGFSDGFQWLATKI